MPSVALSRPLWWAGVAGKMAGFKEREEMYTLIVRFVRLPSTSCSFYTRVVLAHKRVRMVVSWSFRASTWSPHPAL